MFSDFDDEATPNFVFDRTPTPDFDLHNTPSYWTDIKTAEPEPKLILAMGPRVDTLAPGEYVGFHIMSRQGELSNGRFGEPPRFFALEYDFSVLSGSPIDVYLFELEEWENWAKNRQSYYLSNGSKLNATSGSVSTLVSNQPYALVFYNRSSRTSRVSIDI
ncbi:hypothetical protein [Haladaptatus sp. YSMS36]|uniref:hypothetical protein n=1 Tax=Haladaptatus sp. YSMS36 TaxID=3033384 RepID=UPI0023E81FCE|nr:hypothetical protein [Haladaptatus sp. YSMS36]